MAFFPGGDVHRFAAVLRGKDAVALLLENARSESAYCRLVLDQQNRLRAARLLVGYDFVFAGLESRRRADFRKVQL